MSTILQGDNIRTLIINRDAIPYRADIRLEGITYTLEFHYNHLHDYFTVDLWRQGVAVAKGEKIVYARALFEHLPPHHQPPMPIVPLDPSAQATRVGWDELGTSVQLYIIEEDDVVGDDTTISPPRAPIEVHGLIWNYQDDTYERRIVWG